MINHWLLPPDANSIEQQIAQWSILNIYEQFDDPVDHTIIALCYELGYPQAFAAQVLGKTEKTIGAHIKKIKITLTKSHGIYLK